MPDYLTEVFFVKSATLATLSCESVSEPKEEVWGRRWCSQGGEARKYTGENH